MKDYIQKEQLNALTIHLRSINASCQSKFTLKEAVKKHYSTIEKLRKKYRKTWEEIAVVFQESLQVSVKASSLETYFNQITAQKRKRHQDTLAHSSPNRMNSTATQSKTRRSASVQHSTEDKAESRVEFKLESPVEAQAASQSAQNRDSEIDNLQSSSQEETQTKLPNPERPQPVSKTGSKVNLSNNTIFVVVNKLFVALTPRYNREAVGV